MGIDMVYVGKRIWEMMRPKEIGRVMGHGEKRMRVEKTGSQVWCNGLLSVICDSTTGLWKNSE